MALYQHKQVENFNIYEIALRSRNLNFVSLKGACSYVEMDSVVFFFSVFFFCGS